MKELRSEFNSKGHGVLSISAGDNLMPGRELSASTLPLFSHFMDQAGFEFAALFFSKLARIGHLSKPGFKSSQ